MAEGDKSPTKEIQAIGFAKEDTCNNFLAWFIPSCTIKDKTDNDNNGGAPLLRGCPLMS